MHMKLFADDVKLALAYELCNRRIVCNKPATCAEKEPDYMIGARAVSVYLYPALDPYQQYESNMDKHNECRT